MDFDFQMRWLYSGGIGDITHRKLVPSLYNLAYKETLPDNFAMVVVGRIKFADEGMDASGGRYR